jgi:lysostaphin
MSQYRWLPLLSVLSWVSLSMQMFAAPQTTCTAPVLSRLVRHKIAARETVEGLSQKYNLIPATLMGLNPVLRGGTAPVGTEILVPPFNGIRVEVQPGQTWRDVARAYGVRADVLFEVNGCQQNPRVVFVPGVNWSPIAERDRTPSPQAEQILSGYPLPSRPSRAAVLLGYGWGILPATGQVGFHSGVDLQAKPGTPVLAVADGTVAFAGKQGAYGNLIVLNHAEGLQTRYAQVEKIQVRAGQALRRGQTIGTSGSSGTPSSREPHLHFEVRSRSQLGWVAENPEIYLLRTGDRADASL